MTNTEFVRDESAAGLVVPNSDAVKVQLPRTCSIAGNGYSEIAQFGLFNQTGIGALA